MKDLNGPIHMHLDDGVIVFSNVGTLENSSHQVFVQLELTLSFTM